jgi:hypothetical protein
MNKIIQLSKGDSRYGAQMGRSNSEVHGKCRLQRVRMVDGDYDYDWTGAYWGLGTPLYVCEDSSKNLFFVRAWDRASAKVNVLEYNKDVTFYR